MDRSGRFEDRSAAISRKRIRVVLADDHQEVLDQIRELLTPEFEILRTVSDGPALVRAATELRPDAVISDIRMPGLSGIEACRQILENGLCEALVMLTMYKEPLFVRGALSTGIRGYVLKVDAGEELASAVYEVLRGGTYISQGVRNN